jgi:hypothetical protein
MLSNDHEYHQPPLVILLDIDGTLIGDITPQIVIYELIGKLRQ